MGISGFLAASPAIQYDICHEVPTEHARPTGGIISEETPLFRAMWCGLTVRTESQLAVALQMGFPRNHPSSPRPISEEILGGPKQLEVWSGID